MHESCQVRSGRTCADKISVNLVAPTKDQRMGRMRERGPVTGVGDDYGDGVLRMHHSVAAPHKSRSTSYAVFVKRRPGCKG